MYRQLATLPKRVPAPSLSTGLERTPLKAGRTSCGQTLCKWTLLMDVGATHLERLSCSKYHMGAKAKWKIEKIHSSQRISSRVQPTESRDPESTAHGVHRSEQVVLGEVLMGMMRIMLLHARLEGGSASARDDSSDDYHPHCEYSYVALGAACRKGRRKRGGYHILKGCNKKFERRR
jgi:hypothetical protein